MNSINSHKINKRLSYLLSRLIKIFISFCICIFFISITVNSVLETTINAQIIEIVHAALLGQKFSSAEEVNEFKTTYTNELRKYWNMDSPYFVRVLSRCVDIVTLNLGNSKSTVSNYPECSSNVSKIIKDQLVHSLILFTSSTLFSILFAIFIGVKMAKNIGSKLDRTISIAALVTNGFPSWLLGSFMIFLFAYLIPIFKVGKLHTPFFKYKGILFFLDYVYYLLLPFITMVIVKTTSFSYLIRTMLVNPLQEDYITAARGRGIKEKAILYKHGLRVVAPSVVTMSAQAIAQSVAGDIIVEIVMARPGLGFTFYQAIKLNDTSLTVAVLAILTIIYCSTFAILDIVYVSLDPRIGSAT